MSIVFSLKRLFDPTLAREEQEALRKLREPDKRDDEGGEPPKYRCRVCGRVETQKNYCPACLADTMLPEPPP